MFTYATLILGIVGPCLPRAPQKDVGGIEESSQQEYRIYFLVFNHSHSSLFRELNIHITY